MDDRRARFRKGLSPLYLPLYDALCELLPSDWQPFYGIRSFEEQAELYAQGRTIPGHVVTNAQAGESPHQYGCASDWIMWEDKLPVWAAATDPRWQVYWNACDKAGARKGHEWGDNPHNELEISVSWVKVHGVYLAQGMEAAQAFIAGNRAK